MCGRCLQALQLEHTKQLTEAHAKTQQACAQQKTLQESLDSKQAELQQALQRLAAAEKALAAARTEAEVQLAAASTAQQALRQQLLEVRGERLQLQEKLAGLQSSSGSSQHLLQQMLVAQQDAAAVAAGLKQQLQQAHAQVQEQQARLQSLAVEKGLLEGRLAEAMAGKEAAARQAAAAGEKLAVAVAAQEAMKLQIEVGNPQRLALAGSDWLCVQRTSLMRTWPGLIECFNDRHLVFAHKHFNLGCFSYLGTVCGSSRFVTARHPQGAQSTCSPCLSTCDAAVVMQAVGKDVARRSWDQQQQHQQLCSAPAAWQPQQQFPSLAAGSQAYSPPGSPYRAGQLESSRQQLDSLAQTLALRDAGLSEVNAELEQAQVENQQLYEQLQGLQAELTAARVDGTRSNSGRGAIGLQQQQQSVAAAAGGVVTASASKTQYALAELQQLTESMELLESRLRQAADVGSKSGRTPPAVATAIGLRTSAEIVARPAVDGSRSDTALAAAACAVAQVRREVRRLSSELHDGEHTVQLQQQQLHGVQQPVQQVQALQKMVSDVVCGGLLMPVINHQNSCNGEVVDAAGGQHNVPPCRGTGVFQDLHAVIVHFCSIIHLHAGTSAEL